MTATVCAFYTKSREILLLQRRKNDRTISGFCLPGGKIDVEHESIIEGLCREITEETGVVVSKGNLKKLGQFKAVSGVNVDVYCHQVHEPFEVRLSNEHVGFYWGTEWETLPLAGNTTLALDMLSHTYNFIDFNYVFPAHSKYSGKKVSEIINEDSKYVSYWVGRDDTIASKDLEKVLKKEMVFIRRSEQSQPENGYTPESASTGCTCGGFCKGLCDRCDQLENPF